RRPNGSDSATAVYAGRPASGGAVAGYRPDEVLTPAPQAGFRHDGHDETRGIPVGETGLRIPSRLDAGVLTGWQADCDQPADARNAPADRGAECADWKRDSDFPAAAEG